MFVDGWLNSLGNTLVDVLPKYTEPWATTYLQILFQSFLFALGVPTALYSLVVDNDIKRVAQTRVKFKRYFVGTMMLYVAVLFIVWLVHPQGDKGGAADAQNAASIIKSVIAASAVTILPLIVLAYGNQLNKAFKRETVVANLANELLASLDKKQNIDTGALKDLSYLGEHGRAGDEKDVVLNVIESIVDSVRQRVEDGRLRYKGYELDSLIRHIPEMLDNTAQPGNDENFTRAAEVLINTWRWIGQNKVRDDAIATREALRRLALYSVQRMAEATSHNYLEIAAECDTHMVFEMALASIKAGKYPLAIAALGKLESLAGIAVSRSRAPEEDKKEDKKEDRKAEKEEDKKYRREALESAAKEAKGNLLGAAARLAAGSPSGALRAEKILRDNEEIFSPSIRRSLADAFDYHSNAGYLDIADEVRRLSASAEKMKTIDLDRPIQDGA